MNFISAIHKTNSLMTSGAPIIQELLYQIGVFKCHIINMSVTLKPTINVCLIILILYLPVGLV